MRGDCAADARFDYVSYNAVTRYVQRILGVEVTELDGLDPRAVASAHCAAAGRSFEEVAETIATSIAVVTARRLGVSQVGSHEFRAHLKGGVVTTITAPSRRFPGGFRSEPSRRELQRHIRREAHCRRHVPGRQA